MKKIFAAIFCVTVMLSTGCAASPDNREYSNSKEIQYSSVFQDTEPNYGYEDNDYWDYDDLTYEDLLFLCRDEIISQAKSVSYQQLARSVDGMEGEYVKVKGQIIQAFNEDDYITGMIAITDIGYGYYDDLIIYSIPKDFVAKRPIEGDIATLWGVCTGLSTYESARGDIRTEPTIGVAKIQIH